MGGEKYSTWDTWLYFIFSYRNSKLTSCIFSEKHPYYFKSAMAGKISDSNSSFHVKYCTTGKV